MFGISLRLRLTKVPTSGAARQYRSISSGWPYRLDMSRFVFFFAQHGGASKCSPDCPGNASSVISELPEY